MSAFLAISCSGHEIPTATVVVTLREGPTEPTLGLAWSHDGHIRSCDLGVRLRLILDTLASVEA